MATCGMDAILTLWNLDTMSGVWAHTRMDAVPKNPVFSNDSKYLAYHEERDKTIKAVSVATGAAAQVRLPVVWAGADAGVRVRVYIVPPGFKDAHK